jgi:hypothetical protein
VNARTRTARQILKARTRTQRAAAKIRREGVATLATHCVAAGLGVKEARTVAGSLRKNAARANVTGTVGVSYTHGRARQCTRRADYKVAAARLALAA